MRTEIPVFKRCCFCMPLRRGVLTWTYIKTIVLLWLLSLDVYSIRWISRGYDEAWYIARFIILVLFKLTAVAFSIFLITAAHMKNTRLLRVSYWCELVSIISLTLIFIGSLIFDCVVHMFIIFFFLKYVILLVLIQLIYFVLQLYVIALIRSEVLKLESQHEFRFVNQAAEAECQYYGQGAPPSPRAARPPSEHTVQEQDEEIV